MRPATGGREGHGREAFRRLAAMSARDVLRNPLTGVSMWFMTGIILVIYVSMWLAFVVLGPAPVASVDAADPRIASALERAGVRVVAEDAPERNTVVTVVDGRALVVLDASDQAAWDPIWLGLRDAGVRADAVTVVDDEGDAELDPLQENLGIVVLVGVASVAFIGTTVPLVAMRERGLLRLLGTTPLRRSTFLLAQLPLRALVAVGVLLLTAGIAVWRRYVDGLDLLTLGTSFLLGTTMLFAVALASAARSRNAEATQQTMVMVTLGLVFASGGLLPQAILPAAVQVVMNCLPTTWFVAATSASLTGAEPFLPVPALWGLMAVVTVAAGALAVRRFEWDQSERRPGATETSETSETSDTRSEVTA
ncbi:ABC transporter permease [Plantibacter sp. ME-Dv--P-095]|uniref:ABC transporter permease n=1 Tax=Plantibacter sp. ME-Dv--P-095 TaxID=3040299 RepID=UPI00254E1A4A|nr:ABC transporter permease [Plantibacter sp. ME-Dv--P-095]